MRRVIYQSIPLPVPARTLFEQYTTPELHAAITGSSVTISARAGAEFQAFDGLLQGTMLTVVEPVLVVQSWRSVAFHDDDRDSTLILCFRPEDTLGYIELVHLDVPDHDFQGVTEGWEKNYWTPWRNYLATDRPRVP